MIQALCSVCADLNLELNEHMETYEVVSPNARVDDAAELKDYTIIPLITDLGENEDYEFIRFVEADEIESHLL